MSARVAAVMQYHDIKVTLCRPLLVIDKGNIRSMLRHCCDATNIIASAPAICASLRSTTGCSTDVMPLATAKIHLLEQGEVAARDISIFTVPKGETRDPQAGRHVIFKYTTRLLGLTALVYRVPWSTC